MKHVYLRILFVMNCFWAEMGKRRRWVGGSGRRLSSKRKKVNDKCHVINKRGYLCVFEPVLLPDSGHIVMSVSSAGVDSRSTCSSLLRTVAADVS